MGGQEIKTMDQVRFWGHNCEDGGELTALTNGAEFILIQNGPGGAEKQLLQCTTLKELAEKTKASPPRIQDYAYFADGMDHSTWDVIDTFRAKSWKSEFLSYGGKIEKGELCGESKLVLSFFGIGRRHNKCMKADASQNAARRG